MPTGYTAGIIDGKTKDFKQFATDCMRAFGAAIHMRDDSFDAIYEPRKPGDYYQKEIDKATARLEATDAMSDEKILLDEQRILKKDIARWKAKIKLIAKNRSKLGSMLADAIIYEAPTSEHVGIKEFMQQQLTDTINGDGNPRYYKEALFESETALANLIASNVRKERTEAAMKDLVYYTKALTEETDRCNKSNEWVAAYLKSIS